MKQIRVILVCMLVLSMILSIPVMGAENEKLSVTEKQKVILKNLGATEDQIVNLTPTMLNSFLKRVPAPKTTQVSPPSYSQADIVRAKKLSADKGLTVQELNTLENLGYTEVDIVNLSPAELKEILAKYSVSSGSDVSIMSTVTYTKPIPYFGSVPGAYTSFDSSVGISDAEISYYSEDSMTFAEFVFNRTYNYSTTQSGQNLRFSYFLYGETSPGVHEGVDVRDTVTYNRAVRAAAPGVIVGSVGGTYGLVSVYTTNMLETLNYQHLQSIPANVLNKTQPVGVGTTIGNQGNAGTSDYHLHIMALPGQWTGSIPTGSDTYLVSDMPYGYMTYYL